MHFHRLKIKTRNRSIKLCDHPLVYQGQSAHSSSEILQNQPQGLHTI